MKKNNFLSNAVSVVISAKIKVRLIFNLLVLFLLIQIYESKAQLSSLYTFAYNGTTNYASVAGTTLQSTAAGVSVDAVFTAIPIGFTFTYNCQNYTTCGISNNGFIWFGTGTVSATQYTPLSSQVGEVGAVDGIISVYGCNITGTNAVAALRYGITGVAPNRVFTVEWKSVLNGGVERCDHEIKLTETTNRIDLIHYDSPYLVSGTSNGQVGLRGNAVTNFLNRKTSGASNWCASLLGTLNTDVCQIVATTACNYASSATLQEIDFIYTLTGSCCTPPTTQASAFTSSGITTTSCTVGFTRGNGTGGVLVVARTSATTQASPTNGTNYAAPSLVFGSGTLIGAGNYAVYNGVANGAGAVTTPITITGLSVNSAYAFDIYEYTGVSFCYKTPSLTGTVTTLNGPMSYLSSTTVQQTGNIAQGALNQAIIQIQVVTSGGTSPALSLSSLSFKTNGSTTIATDLTAARIWYTGASSTFATTTQFGSDVTSFPGATTAIPVSGSQTLVAGTNYFWVAYDINAGASIGNVMDAECSSVTPGSVQTPSVQAPAGSRTIAAPGNVACAYTGSSQAITFTTIVGLTAPAPTLIASGSAIDDNNYTAQPIGFNFEFNGTTYTTFGINSNGFIWFGTGTPAALPTFPVISNASANLGGAGTIDGLIVACGADLWAHPHILSAPALTQINRRVSGVVPNRVITIEFTGFHNKSVGNNDLCWQVGNSDDHRLDFQIKLYECATGATSPGRIEMVYRDQNPFCINATRTLQIGLRGTTNADFNTRANPASNVTSASTTLGAAASTVISFPVTWFSGTNVGIRYSPNILTPTLTPSPTATNICPATTVALTGAALAPASPAWQWYKNGVAIAGAVSSTYSSGTSGTFLLIASNAGCGRISNSTAVTIISCCASPGLWTAGAGTSNWNTGGNWCSGTVPISTTDVTIPGTAPFQPDVSANATCHSLSIADAFASLTISSNTLSVTGDITNNGSYNHIAGTLELNGTVMQTIPPLMCYDVKINNAAGVFTSGDLIIWNTLNLFNGILSTGGSIIHLFNPASAAVYGFSNTNYINGRLERFISNGDFDFPVGDATNYELATVTVNNLSPTSSLLGEYFTGVGGCTTVPVANTPLVNGTLINQLLDAGFWSITPDAQPSSGSYDIQINERGYTNTPPGAAYCAVIKRDDCFSNWQSLGVHNNATQSIGGGTVTAKRSTLTSFSDFGVGFSGNVLPVELTNFTAVFTDNNLNALLQWSTASELNNDHFELEVATDEVTDGGLNFRKMGEVQGNGTSLISHSYSFTDREANKDGTRYYRLKQVDTDGSSSFSQIVSLTFSNEQIHLSSLYPNPTSDFINYDLNSTGAKDVKISITNLLGQEMISSEIKLVKGLNNLSFDVSEFAQGVYFINITDADNNGIHRKFEKY